MGAANPKKPILRVKSVVGIGFLVLWFCGLLGAFWFFCNQNLNDWYKFF
jgi:hypothetical protein